MFEFIPFKEEHFAIYAAWFEDPDLKLFLGGIDSEWLVEILNSQNDRTYIIKSNNNWVAVLTITLPTENVAFYVINSIAIHPSYRKRGLANIILRTLHVNLLYLENLIGKAYVDKANIAAVRLFDKSGWQMEEDPSDKDVWAFTRYG